MNKQTFSLSLKWFCAAAETLLWKGWTANTSQAVPGKPTGSGACILSECWKSVYSSQIEPLCRSTFSGCKQSLLLFMFYPFFVVSCPQRKHHHLVEDKDVSCAPPPWRSSKASPAWLRQQSDTKTFRMEQKGTASAVKSVTRQKTFYPHLRIHTELQTDSHRWRRKMRMTSRTAEIRRIQGLLPRSR